ncbi:MAG: HNH endonuclease [Planctomycetaceae bacterium]|nr:HNH endonuclease [Planctomycetaceae bacterium]
MDSERRNWTREELILALDLYCRIPFGQINQTNPLVIELAKLLGRTPASVSMKMGNLGRFDATLQNRNVTGLKHGSKKDEEVWNEFNNRWQQLAVESAEIQRKQFSKQLLPALSQPEDLIPEGATEKQATVKVRLVQRFFRDSVLSSYEYACSFCQIAMPDLLNASHIIPWCDDESKRADPRNGLCLCTLHDRAFDRGYLSVDSGYSILISKDVKRANVCNVHKVALLDIQGKTITLPNRFVPNVEYFEYHRNKIFRS